MLMRKLIIIFLVSIVSLQQVLGAQNITKALTPSRLAVLRTLFKSRLNNGISSITSKMPKTTQSLRNMKTYCQNNKFKILAGGLATAGVGVYCRRDQLLVAGILKIIDYVICYGGEGSTLLSLAISTNDIEMVEFLLKNGANPNALCDKQYEMYFLREGTGYMYKDMIKRECSPLLPLEKAFENKASLNVIECLLKHGATISPDILPLCIQRLAKFNDINLIKKTLKAIENNSSIFSKIRLPNFNSQEILTIMAFSALESDADNILQYCLDNGLDIDRDFCDFISMSIKYKFIDHIGGFNKISNRSVINQRSMPSVAEYEHHTYFLLEAARENASKCFKLLLKKQSDSLSRKVEHRNFEITISEDSALGIAFANCFYNYSISKANYTCPYSSSRNGLEIVESILQNNLDALDDNFFKELKHSLERLITVEQYETCEKLVKLLIQYKPDLKIKDELQNIVKNQTKIKIQKLKKYENDLKSYGNKSTSESYWSWMKKKIGL